MNYKRKSPLDYKDIAENLRNPAWYDLENGTDLLDDASAAITDLLARAEAAEEQIEEKEKYYAQMIDALAANDSEELKETKEKLKEVKERAEKAEKEVDQYKQFLQNWHEHKDEERVDL